MPSAVKQPLVGGPMSVFKAKKPGMAMTPISGKAKTPGKMMGLMTPLAAAAARQSSLGAATPASVKTAGRMRDAPLSNLYDVYAAIAKKVWRHPCM